MAYFLRMVLLLFGHGMGSGVFFLTSHSQKNMHVQSIYIEGSIALKIHKRAQRNGINYGVFGTIKIKSKRYFGEVAEWSIAPVLKTGIVSLLSRVRIPLSPFFCSMKRSLFFFFSLKMKKTEQFE